MYAFINQREWFAELGKVMSSVSEHIDETIGPDKQKRPRVRKSYLMLSLPDKRGRVIQMAADHKLALMCFLTHIDDVEAESSFCFVTVGTVAQWVGCGNTKAEGIVKQLRDVGLIGRKRRDTTSTQTFLYRTAGYWEQQAIDELPNDRMPAEPVKTVPTADGSKPSEIGKTAPKEALDEDTERWLSRIERWLLKPETEGYDSAQIPEPGGADLFDSKETADKIITLLKSRLVTARRTARAVVKDDKWFVIALLRPEIIASNSLTEHYGREIRVDRLPRIDGVDEFSLSCTMMRLFKSQSKLYERYITLFGQGIANPAGQLVKNVSAIVQTDASISTGFPFYIDVPQAESTGKPSRSRGAEANCANEEQDDENAKSEREEDQDEDAYDADKYRSKDDAYDEDDYKPEDENAYDEDNFKPEEDDDNESKYDEDGKILPRYKY